MISNVINALLSAARGLVRNRRTLLLLMALYGLLLTTLYLFVVTREANISQLALTIALTIFAPILFFILQAMGVSYMHGESATTPGPVLLLRQALRSFWKLIVVSLPVLLLAGLLVYGLNRIEARFVPGATGVVEDAPESSASEPDPTQSGSRVRWKAATLSAVRLTIFGLVLPLIVIHLWIAAARDGLAATLRQAHRLLAHALAPRAVLAYLIGSAIFIGIPYLCLFIKTPVKTAWLDLMLLGLRLGVAFVCAFFGWVTTQGALAGMTIEGTARIESTEADEGEVIEQSGRLANSEVAGDK